MNNKSHLTLLYLAALLALYLRRPDAILHAQFYAEDGSLWFASAYNLGWQHVLLTPYQGYLHLLPRLAAALAQLVPITHAPLVENLIALCIEALPVPLLLSARSAAWGPLRTRALLATLYLALPNTSEIIATLTESQWLLALIALLILFAAPPASKQARAFDLILLTLSAFTGPFSLVLLPIALYQLWHHRHQLQPRLNAAILFAGCIAQTLSLVFNSAARYHPPLGATFAAFARILAGQVYLAALVGANGFASLMPLPGVLITLILATLLLIFALPQLPIPMRALLIVAAALFAAALASPIAYPAPGDTAWHMLLKTGGGRYWFFPTLAFAWSLIYVALSTSKPLRAAAIACLLLLPIGLYRDYRYPAFADLHYPQFAAQFALAPLGTTATIPLNPTGWQMHLTKH